MCLSTEEREKLLDEMNPESREDAYLSLYTTTLEAAFGLEKKMLDSDKVEPEAAVNLALRLRSAGDYLDRLAGISDKWEPLKQEFKERFSPYLWSLKNAYAWAA